MLLILLLILKLILMLILLLILLLTLLLNNSATKSATNSATYSAPNSATNFKTPDPSALVLCLFSSLVSLLLILQILKMAGCIKYVSIGYNSDKYTLWTQNIPGIQQHMLVQAFTWTLLTLSFTLLLSFFSVFCFSPTFGDT